MAVRYPSIHNRSRQKAAVIVYALVFTMAAAAILYVAASIYQARQKAQIVQDYATERHLVRWQAANAMRTAYRNSLVNGYGVLGSSNKNCNIWLTFDPINSAYGVPASADAPTSVVSANADALSFVKNTFFSLLSGTDSDYGWTNNGEWISEIDSFALGNRFDPSCVFTAPGFRPRRLSTGPLAPSAAGKLAEVPSHFGAASSDAEQNFIPFSSDPLKFPHALYWRNDLPFGGNGSGGLVRWARETIHCYLEVKSGELGGEVTSERFGASLWTVEEPITNYQLVLLPEGAGTQTPDWSMTAAANGATYPSITIGNTSTERGKILVWGNVGKAVAGGGNTPTASNSFGIDSPQGTSEDKPIMAVVRGGIRDTSAFSNFDYRLAKPDTVVSFGRASANLEGFLTHFPLNNTPQMTREALRIIEITNSQASTMPWFFANDNTFSRMEYVNSVLRLSQPSASVTASWTRQGIKNDSTTWGVADTRETTLDPNFKKITALHYDDTTVSVTGTPPVNTAAAASTYIPEGLTAAALGAAPSTIVYKIDLSKLDLGRTDISSSGAASNGNPQPWMVPNEIRITTKAAGINKTIVWITGGGSFPATNAQNPVRIVVDGSPSSAMDNTYIYFEPSSLFGETEANRRPFILVLGSQATHLVFGPPAPGLANDRWHGVIIAPYGFSVESCCYNIDTSQQLVYTPSTTSSGTLSWFGTWVTCRNLTFAAGAHITLYPDPDIRDIFTPNYGQMNLQPAMKNLSYLGRPMPLWVPRLAWIFE